MSQRERVLLFLESVWRFVKPSSCQMVGNRWARARLEQCLESGLCP